MLEPITCKWHLCRNGSGGTPAIFTPARMTQEFCCDECRNARAAWRARRGSVLVDVLLEGDFDRLRELRANLIRETANV